MDRGFVKFWRKTFDSGMHRNHKLFTLWMWLLAHASHKKHGMYVGNTKIDLEPGQLVTGLKSLSDDLNISIQSTRTFLRILKNQKNLTIKTTNKFSIITIMNWDIYNGVEIKTNNQNNKQLTNNQQTTNNKQEWKEGKEYKSPIGDSSTNAFVDTPDDTESSDSKSINCPQDKIIELYHNHCPSLPKVRSWPESGKRNLRQRWRESSERQNLEWWAGYFKTVSASAFLTGKVSHWSANLQWLVNPTNFAKVINGNYTDKASPVNQKNSESESRVLLTYKGPDYYRQYCKDNGLTPDESAISKWRPRQKPKTNLKIVTAR